MKKINQKIIPEYLREIVYLLGFISLLGPPKSFEIKKRSELKHNELSGKSLLVILISESTFRASVFLLLCVIIEQLIGDELFELYRVDYIYAGLIFSGIVHILSYYLGIIIIWHSRKKFGLKIYRLGRNIAYSIIPASIAVLITLLSQHYQQIEPFSGDIVQQVFISVYAFFVLVGGLESLFKKGMPMSIGYLTFEEESSLS